MQIGIRSEKLERVIAFEKLGDIIPIEDVNFDSMRDCMFLLKEIERLILTVKVMEDYEDEKLKNKEESKKSEESKDSV